MVGQRDIGKYGRVTVTTTLEGHRRLTTAQLDRMMDQIARHLQEEFVRIESKENP